VEIVKKCRSLGLGPGGFYQPGYADGSKLRLKMMCLGMDWDPQTRKYGPKRAIDGSKPPSIPHYFSNLVIRAIQEAHNLINQESGISYVEDILPSMTPDICIANFYETSGRLGLHQVSYTTFLFAIFYIRKNELSEYLYVHIFTFVIYILCLHFKLLDAGSR
jgi:hypothetical protein